MRSVWNHHHNNDAVAQKLEREEEAAERDRTVVQKILDHPS
jgi:hypothetical protein